MIQMMELCTARGVSNLPHLSPTHAQFRCGTDGFLQLHKETRLSFGLRQRSNSTTLRSLKSDETSTDTTDANWYVKDDTKIDGSVTLEDDDSQLNEVPQAESLTDNPLQLLKFLEDLDVKLDFEDTYSILVFGGGGAVALWLLSAIVGAIDSVPVLPKVLELVGLGYTIWFSSRYLIFKKNRDELAAKVEQVKQQILGSQGDK